MGATEEAAGGDAEEVTPECLVSLSLRFTNGKGGGVTIVGDPVTWTHSGEVGGATPSAVIPFL